jgi:hypothetical protein
VHVAICAFTPSRPTQPIDKDGSRVQVPGSSARPLPPRRRQMSPSGPSVLAPPRTTPTCTQPGRAAATRPTACPPHVRSAATCQREHCQWQAGGLSGRGGCMLVRQHAHCTLAGAEAGMRQPCLGRQPALPQRHWPHARPSTPVFPRGFVRHGERPVWYASGRPIRRVGPLAEQALRYPGSSGLKPAPAGSKGGSAGGVLTLWSQWRGSIRQGHGAGSSEQGGT